MLWARLAKNSRNSSENRCPPHFTFFNRYIHMIYSKNFTSMGQKSVLWFTDKEFVWNTKSPEVQTATLTWKSEFKEGVVTPAAYTALVHHRSQRRVANQRNYQCTTIYAQTKTWKRWRSMKSIDNNSVTISGGAGRLKNVVAISRISSCKSQEASYWENFLPKRWSYYN